MPVLFVAEILSRRGIPIMFFISYVYSESSCRVFSPLTDTASARMTGRSCLANARSISCVECTAPRAMTEERNDGGVVEISKDAVCTIGNLVRMTRHPAANNWAILGFSAMGTPFTKLIPCQICVNLALTSSPIVGCLGLLDPSVGVSTVLMGGK